MTTVIEAYNYKIGLDVSSLQGGGIITKRELAQLKRDFYSLQDPVERTAGKLDRLTNALNKGAIDNDRYAEAVRRIKSSFPETIAAQQKQNDLEKQAQAIKRSLMTETQLVAAESKRLGEIVKAGKLSFDEAKQAMASYKAGLPSAAAAARELAKAERERAELQRFAQSIVQAGMTDAQRYAAEQTRVAAAVRDAGLSQAEATRHLQAYRAQLPSVIAAEKQAAEARREVQRITQAGMTDAQRYGAEQARVAALVRNAGLSQAEATRHLQAYRAQLPSVIAAEQQAAEARREVQRITQAGMTDAHRYGADQARVAALVRNAGLSQAEATRHLQAYRAQLPSVIAAEQQKNQAMAAAAAIVRQNETASERYKRQLREVNQLHQSGALDARSYSREVKRLKDEANRPVENAGGGFAPMIGQLKTLAGGYIGLQTVRDTFQKSFQMEDARKSMDVFTGSVENGKRIYGDLLQLSQDAPVIGFDKLTNAAQTLLSYNATVDSIIPSLKMLGDISAGDQERFSRLAYAFGQVTAAGVLQGDELRQLMEAGFNPLQIISAKTGESMISLKKRMSEGEISIEMVRDAMASVTGPGGRFFGLLEARGQTASGSLAKLKSEVTLLQAELGSLFHEDIAVMLGSIAAGIRTVRGEAAGDGQESSGFFSGITSSLHSLVTPLASAAHLWRKLNEAWDASQESRDVAGAWIKGMSSDLYNVGEGILRLDWDRVAGGFSGDATVALLDNLSEAKKKADDLKAATAANPANVTSGVMSDSDREALRKQQEEASKPVLDEIEALKTRNLEIQMGKQWAEQYKLLNSDAPDTVKAEYRELVARNKELERAEAIKNKAKDLEGELGKARELQAIRSQMPKLDDETASQLAELKILGATGAELNRHLGLRRELVAIEGRRQAEEDAADRFKQLVEDAKQVKDSLKSPMQGLAEDFVKLSEMYRAGLLSAEEYAASKTRAARELVNIPNELATKAVSMGDGSDIYAALVDSQNNREKRDLENLEAARLQRQAERLAQREAARFEMSKLVTGQMREQARLTALINQANPQNGQQPTQRPVQGPEITGEDNEMLDRIALACERAADRLSDWKIVGV